MKKTNRKNDSKAIKGSKLQYNASQATRYYNAMLDLIIPMCEETNREVKKLFKSEPAKKYFAMDADISSQAKILLNSLKDKFMKLFAKKAPKIVDNMVKGAFTTSETALKSSLKKMSEKLTLNTGIVTPDMDTMAKAIVYDNVSLIKTIPEKYLSKVMGSVMHSITSGEGLNTLVPELKKYYGSETNKAHLVALDQTRKAYNYINKGRMEKLGVEEYEWGHSGGSQHPRELHEQMDGNIYRFDTPPIIDKKTEERGIPGQLPNCRCTMTPVIKFDDDE